ncbi:NUDIX domain-containing protein [Criblamydia sequanensis]|uniref:Nudix hydrolase n=1 Tax=Candidatus Criblamydia sequanensis CRIB-18 TaxID=1437425 RepID=A0A090CYP4_9BACT|nr:NUDIX domain-containing protein [Criblamydia sequanensis]CDR33661.1 Nudix hydrolase [Criblamydia sequanensis CRIB-18]
MEEKTHIGVYGILLKNDQLLFVRKTRGPYKGKLDLPGGRPNFGEDLSLTLLREIEEETGVVVKKASLFKNLSCLVKYKEEGKEKSLYHIALVYLIFDFDESQLEKKNSEDVNGYEWVSIEEASKKELSEMASLTLKLILS